MTRCFRSPEQFGPDVLYGQWDGINGDREFWDLNDDNVYWWSRNCGHGFTFEARVRNI